MDFVKELPWSDRYDAVWVVVDCYTYLSTEVG